MSSVHPHRAPPDRDPARADMPGRSSVEELSVDQDLTTGRFDVEGFGHRATLRPWTWGERRRLLAACTRQGALDPDELIEILCRLVYEPMPPAALAPLFACAALDRFGARPGRAAAPLEDAELLLARELGWGPRELDEQPAPDVDRLVDRLRSERATAAEHEAGATGPGQDHEWTVIRIDDQERR